METTASGPIPLVASRRPRAVVGHSAGPAAALATGLALGWAAEMLFYRRPLGVSGPLFVLALVAALLALAHRERVRPRVGNLCLLAPTGFFAAMLALRASPLLSTINLLTLLVLLSLLAALFARGRLEALMLPGFPLVVAHALGTALLRPGPALFAATRQVDVRRRLPVLRGVLLGTCLALPLLVVFAALFASADSVFDTYLRRLVVVELADVLDWLARAGLVVVVGWMLAGGLLLALGARDRAKPLPGTLAPPFQVGWVEAATVLGLVDLLFLAFGWIQVVYVFSDQALRTMDFETYRLYARRGFFELLVVAVLTMALILALRWWTRAEAGLAALAMRGLASLMVGLALLILLSAFTRLLVWEQVEYYIQTGPRLYVRWFMLWLGIAFGWLLLSLWWLPNRFAIGGFAAWLGFLATVNLTNPEAEVAAYNLRRSDDLSVRFVWELSDDAVPTLVGGLATLPEANRADLAQHLATRLAILEERERREGWQSWHLARAEALRALREARQDGRLRG